MVAKKAGRKAQVSRKTKETNFTISVDLDGSGKAQIKTGLGFFDHMLGQIARHGLVDLTAKGKGDLEVDGHHTVEDVGILLGQTIGKALGDRAGITRYASMRLPMMDALVQVSMDAGGRGESGLSGDVPGGADWASSIPRSYANFSGHWRRKPESTCTLRFATARTATTWSKRSSRVLRARSARRSRLIRLKRVCPAPKASSSDPDGERY